MTVSIPVSSFNEDFITQLNANFTAVDGYLDDAAYNATSLASLKSLSGDDLAGVVITQYRTTAGDGGGGTWVWRSGDQSANVTADTQSGIWAAPNSDTSGASGAWQRMPHPLLATGSPVIPYSFAGVNGLNSINATTTATSTDKAEIVGIFGITNGTSGTSKLDTYKMGLAAFALATGANAAYTWASNFVADADASVGDVSVIGCEIDLNINNQAYSAATGPAYAANLYLTGTAAVGKYGNAGVLLAYGGGTNPLWNYGILSVDYNTANAYNTAFISDQSKSPTILHATNTHTNGIDLSGATISGSAFKSAAFNVSGAGVVSVGKTAAPAAGVMGIKAGTNQNIEVRAGIVDTTAIAINAVNDAGSGSVPLELYGSRITLSNALRYGGVDLSNSVTGAGSMVLSESPALTGTPTAPTPAASVVNTTVITAAFVGAAWTSFTPTVSSAGGSITSYTASGRYKQIGKLYLVEYSIAITNNGTGSIYLNVSLPNSATPVISGAFAGVEIAATNKFVSGRFNASSNNALLFFYDGTYPGATGYTIVASGMFEAN